MNLLRSGCALAPLGLAFAACVSASTGQTPHKQVNEGPWLRPSAVLRSQIEEQLTRLPWTHGAERVEQIRWLASVGEPAYEQIIPMCLDPRSDVAGSALAALGATGDHRLVEPLRALDWPPEASLDTGLRLERARTFVRLGDWTQIVVLVEGLRDDELWTRSWCSQALFESTKMRFGFEPQGPPEEREEAVQRWEEWVESRKIEGLLPEAVVKEGSSAGSSGSSRARSRGYFPRLW